MEQAMTLTVLAIMPLAVTQVFVVGTGGGGVAHGLTLLIGLLTIYFLPWFVAWSRRHHATDGILLANIVLGWTFVGWFGALAWSVMPVRVDAASGTAARGPSR
jgi:hypothetical protein